jgi:small subunit ribosomal protein S35
LRQEFIPPTNNTPVIVRTINYSGEEMPVLRKRILVAPISKLPLSGPKAVHNFKIIAGVRCTIDPPKDGGVGKDEPKDDHGYVKISGENFPEPNQNLKWANDVLDRMIREANVRLYSLSRPQSPGFHRISWILHLTFLPQTLDFTDLPLDTRHIVGRIRNQRKGGRSLLREPRRLTLADFPKEWLPKSNGDAQHLRPLA